MSMDSEFSMDLRNNYIELPRLKEAVHRYCHLRGLPSNVLFALDLSLDEILTNVISYGYDDEHEHRITVEIHSTAAFVEVEVKDDGKPFNPLEHQCHHTESALTDRPVGGLGIHLVRSYMDEMRYRREGERNCLTMRKNL